MITVSIVDKSASNVRVRVEGVPTYRAVLVNPGDEPDVPEGEQELATATIDLPIAGGQTAESVATAWAQAAFGVPVVPLVDPDAELIKAIEAATDFASLKAALLGKQGASK